MGAIDGQVQGSWQLVEGSQGCKWVAAPGKRDVDGKNRGEKKWRETQKYSPGAVEVQLLIIPSERVCALVATVSGSFGEACCCNVL